MNMTEKMAMATTKCVCTAAREALPFEAEAQLLGGNISSVEEALGQLEEEMTSLLCPEPKCEAQTIGGDTPPLPPRSPHVEWLIKQNRRLVLLADRIRGIVLRLR